MTLTEHAVRIGDTVDLPDVLTKLGIHYLCMRSERNLSAAPPDATAAFARAMDGLPIAMHTDDANAQHYEVPAEFFAQVLGPRRKYSSCFYATGGENLAQAEEAALSQSCEFAQLADGQEILELGCGWGSLTLWMAQHYPRARITAVSNSASQRAYINEQARRLGLANVSVVTADMNVFAPAGQQFDRIVSVEMFEHMANWHALLQRACVWLAPEGRMFVHVFTHAETPYRFDHADKSDWIANYFFTGGIMPSRALMGAFADCFHVEAERQWSGAHYRRTAMDWLKNYDRNGTAIAPMLRETYGADWRIWRRRWRLFFLATAGMFGYGSGNPWGVTHYRLKPVR